MVNAVHLDVLAVAAHPDDAEITCGGLLIKMAGRGRLTGILDLTEGEMGTHGDENDRASEAAKASEVLGLAFRQNASIPDSAVEYNYENKLKIAQVIRDTRPELVLLPHWMQRHPDHLAASRLGYDACFLAGLQKVRLAGEPFRPRKIIYVSYFRNLDYSFLVDISDEFERKIEVVAAYVSQFGSWPDPAQAVGSSQGRRDPEPDTRDVFHPGVNIFEFMHTRARQLGQLAGVRYAEAYTIKEHMLIDDPQKMPVRSI
ncbi:MAG TPA: bacillithiol biosynthesis deacetylase BshB1 [Acidobacteriota bacterium]|nr:bacillithiol biosynthesis deacetylase BshB1 [Acidobacteriota bacterium]